MIFVLRLLVWAGVAALEMLLRPRAPRPSNPSPEQFNAITVVEGRPIPIIWGTRRIKSAVLAWYGDRSQQVRTSGGATIGFKYFLGAQYIICAGPVDAVVGIGWNDKDVGASVTSGSNVIIFGAVAPFDSVAVIQTGNYTNGAALAQAVQTAMELAEPGRWKVNHGFTVVSGRNDKIAWNVIYNGVKYKREATVRAGFYRNGVHVALANAMNIVEDAAPSGLGGRFGFDYSTVSPWASSFAYFKNTGSGSATFQSCTIEGDQTLGFDYTRSILPTIGLRMDINHLIGVNTPGDFAVRDDRFTIAFVGSAAVLKLTDPLCTASILLGYSNAADATLLARTADADFQVISATFTETTDYTQCDISGPQFFGEDGGVEGRVDIYHGSWTQAPSAYLESKWQAASPGYRGVCYSVDHGINIGNSNYPKPRWFDVRRCPNSLALVDEEQNLGGDANPAAVLWEILTDTDWGCGIPASLLSQSSFQAAGHTLALEGLGISMIQDSLASTIEVTQEVLRHIDGILYFDQVTGLGSMRLVRYDYTLATLPVVSTDNAYSCKIARSSWGELRNTVRIKYIDRLRNFKDRVIEEQDLANVQAQEGQTVVEDLNYPGLSSEENATLIALRALRALATPTATVEVTTDRTTWKLRPGDVFGLTWVPFGITLMPCRVTRVSDSGLGDGKITVDAVEDTTGAPWTGYVPPSSIPPIVVDPFIGPPEL